jgi:NADH-quinone oxidoreductase subunit M
VGAIVAGRAASGQASRKAALIFAGISFLCSVAAWAQFELGGAEAVEASTAVITRLLGFRPLAIDQLSAPLLPLAALLFMLTPIATLRTKMRRFSFSWTLVSEGLVLATLACQNAWGIIALLALQCVPPYLELVARKKPTRAFVLHMALFVVLMVIGQGLIHAEGLRRTHSLWAMLPLVIAVFIRSGIVPVHCWMTDLFEHATFGTALLYVTPMMGAYAAVRLVLPIAPDGILRTLGWVALGTAVYASGMALVQREARRFFCYVFLSHSALVFVGLESVSPICLTGALCLWLSVGLSLAGFGLTLRALESRHGRLSLAGYQGAYENTPVLAVCFLLTGMASVGFPGTLGFLGTELLVDGAVQIYPYIGMFVVVAAALNGIAVMKAYFLLFTGKRQESAVALGVGGREWFAVLTMVVLIIGGGLFPQSYVTSRHAAAEHLLQQREELAMQRGEPKHVLAEAQSK